MKIFNYPVQKTRRISLSLILCAAASLVIGAASHPVSTDMEPPSTGGRPTFRRLSEEQYRGAIAQIFGADIKVPGRFEPSVREDGLLAIGASYVVVTPSGLEQYALRAREISLQVLDEAHRAKTLQCTPQSPAAFDEACARLFLNSYGRLLYRRPLTAEESDSVVALARQATDTSHDFYAGVGTALSALLVSPSFVFRMETTEPVPGQPANRQLDAYSLASRISFLLWDTPPDEQLLDAAASGELQTDKGLNRQVDRMMASPRLERGVRAFFADMFGYDQFNGLAKDSALFPIFSSQFRDEAQEQSMRTIVDHLLVQKKDYRDLFTTKKTFLTRSLGALYGVKVDYRGFSGRWMPYTFPDGDPHAGLLTLPAFLMLDPTHEGRSSPTIRGKNVRENFLCQQVPSPPANVNFDIVQDVDDPVHKTARERLKAHMDNPACAGCHRITDPIGFALENYTPVGSFRTHENGVKIDASGTFEGKSYTDASELMQLLRNSPTAPSCVAQRVYEYGVGRQLAPGEENWLEYAAQRFAKNGYRFPDLLRTIATSASFRAVSSDNLASNAK